MTHTEIIGKWGLCEELANELSINIEKNIERFKAYKEGYLLYHCEEVNELYAFLVGYSLKSK